MGFIGPASGGQRKSPPMRAGWAAQIPLYMRRNYELKEGFQEVFCERFFVCDAHLTGTLTDPPIDLPRVITDLENISDFIPVDCQHVELGKH